MSDKKNTEKEEVEIDEVKKDVEVNAVQKCADKKSFKNEIRKNLKSKSFLIENKDEIVKAYKEISKKNDKLPTLTKSQKKTLGIGRDQGKAILSYARISSSKVKIVIDIIKNKNLEEAYGILKHTSRGASPILYKLLKSAEANAVNRDEGQLDSSILYLAEAYANPGPTLKRIMPRAQGRANRIRKRTSHITLIVKEREQV